MKVYGLRVREAERAAGLSPSAAQLHHILGFYQILGVTMAGDFILAVASMMIARLRDNNVTLTLSQVVTDLVQGEFMQLGSKETENERFAHYLTKTYRKTASLIANSVKAVAMLAGADEKTSEIAFQYGRNVGLAFQLVDDLLDFVSSSAAMGKPTAADLKLGLATAPVLFACEKGDKSGDLGGHGTSPKREINLPGNIFFTTRIDAAANRASCVALVRVFVQSDPGSSSKQFSL
ncbi:Decaprenyl-diphosphate synthase subunit 1 [Homalodisca vitripennis]|nr:Decaprenyl-diphosphate synthase subunit 1 [Homalodisca vitripennis]